MTKLQREQQGISSRKPSPRRSLRVLQMAFHLGQPDAGCASTMGMSSASTPDESRTRDLRGTR
jgi:hypothetical protein